MCVLLEVRKALTPEQSQPSLPVATIHTYYQWSAPDRKWGYTFRSSDGKVHDANGFTSRNEAINAAQTKMSA